MIARLILGLGLACAAPALAADVVKPLKIPAGKTFATVRGTIKGDAGVDYRIAAAQGQTLHLLFKPSNRSCYFNVYAPGADEAAHIGSSAGNEFGQNPTQAGVYRAQVYLMRNAARRNETCRYSLSVELTGGGEDQAAQQACRSNAATMYGVEPGAITLGGLVRTAEGASIDAKADKGAEGVKDLRCLFKPDGAFDHIMAMTSDEKPRQPWSRPGPRR